MNSGIYKISSLAFPDRCYIGSAKDFAERKRGHLNTLRKGTHANPKLQFHYNKYGCNDLIFSVIKEVLPLYLILWEQFFIDQVNPYFNICRIAGNSIGRPQSEETKLKRSISRAKNKSNSRIDLGNLNIFPGFKFLRMDGDFRTKANYFYNCLSCGRERMFGYGRILYAVKGMRKYVPHCGCLYSTYQNRLTPKQQKPPKFPKPSPLGRAYNNSTGYIGVFKHGPIYRARIKHKGKLLDCGRYTTALQAHKARQSVLCTLIKSKHVPTRLISQG